MYSSLGGNSVLKKFILFTALLPLIKPQEQDITTIKPGRYIPELYGAHLGKYIPDNSGKYYHIDRPYDGGYGDTGIKYVHDVSGNLVPLSSRNLGPKDHLRFMIDFNYDNSGWQILKFEWLRDGDETYKFKYINENQLFTNSVENGNGSQAQNDAPAGGNGDESEQNDGEGDAHIDGEYSDNTGYNYSYDNNDAATKNVSTNLILFKLKKKERNKKKKKTRTKIFFLFKKQFLFNLFVLFVSTSFQFQYFKH